MPQNLRVDGASMGNTGTTDRRVASNTPYRCPNTRSQPHRENATPFRWWRLKYRFGGKEKRLSLGNCGQVFRYVVATGRAERDPPGDLRGALPPVKGAHSHPSLIQQKLPGYSELWIATKTSLPCAAHCVSPLSSLSVLASYAMQSGLTSTWRPLSGVTR